MPDLKNVKQYIRALEHLTFFLRSLLEEENRVTPPPATDAERLSEFTDLRFLTKSEIWPEAIYSDMLGEETVEEKHGRATSILRDFMKVKLEGKRFLDFGCGEGYVAYKAAELGASYSLGYDIMPSHAWENLKAERFALTSKLEEGDFDYILLNDVLDHCEEPVEALKKVKAAKNLEGKVYLRCHPWTSRHGTHLYKNLNKAYLQLVFSEVELLGMGLLGARVAKPLDPINSYKQWFAESGFSVIRESVITQPVESFFTTRPAISRRIKSNWRNSPDPELAAGTKYPHDIMEIQFADFVLI